MTTTTSRQHAAFFAATARKRCRSPYGSSPPSGYPLARLQPRPASRASARPRGGEREQGEHEAERRVDPAIEPAEAGRARARRDGVGLPGQAEQPSTGKSDRHTCSGNPTQPGKAPRATGHKRCRGTKRSGDGPARSGWRDGIAPDDRIGKSLPITERPGSAKPPSRVQNAESAERNRRESGRHHVAVRMPARHRDCRAPPGASVVRRGHDPCLAPDRPAETRLATRNRAPGPNPRLRDVSETTGCFPCKSRRRFGQVRDPGYQRHL